MKKMLVLIFSIVFLVGAGLTTFFVIEAEKDETNDDSHSQTETTMEVFAKSLTVLETVADFQNSTYQISPIIEPLSHTQNATFSSSNDDIVSVSDDGLAVLKKSGNATVEVKIRKNDKEYLTKTIRFFVSSPVLVLTSEDKQNSTRKIFKISSTQTLEKSKLSFLLTDMDSLKFYDETLVVSEKTASVEYEFLKFGSFGVSAKFGGPYSFSTSESIILENIESPSTSPEPQEQDGGENENPDEHGDPNGGAADGSEQQGDGDGEDEEETPPPQDTPTSNGKIEVFEPLFTPPSITYNETIKSILFTNLSCDNSFSLSYLVSEFNEGEGELEIFVENENILSAALFPSEFVITAKMSGMTTVTLRSVLHPEIKIVFTVTIQ